MGTRQKIWNIIKDIVHDEGLVLFDIDLPTGKSGTLRVFLSREPSDGTSQTEEQEEESAASSPKAEGERGGVGLEDCAAVSRRISASEEIDSLLGEYALEVSSPGINRRLRRPEHFSGAIGEQIRLTYAEDAEAGQSKGKRSMKGLLKSFDGAKLNIEDRASKEVVIVSFDDVQKANIDYIFK